MKFTETGQSYLIVLIIVPYILFLYCMYYLWWYHLLPWKTVQGEIIEAKYETIERNLLIKILYFPIFLFSGELFLSRYWKPVIKYSFEINEENYQADRIRKPNLIYNTEKKAKDFVSKYNI